MKAIFVVDFPPELHLDMGQLIYQDGDVRHGGWGVVGYVPTASTCLVLVETSSAQIATMSADSRYLLVQEVQDAQPEPVIFASVPEVV